MRVFLDTNVLVSAFAARGLSADLFELVLIEHDLITGRRVLDELAKALRGKLRLSAARCGEIAEFIRSEATLVVEKADEADCDVDQDDRFVLGEALAGASEAFVTGDAALISLQSVRGMAIQTPRQFWEAVRTK